MGKTEEVPQYIHVILVYPELEPSPTLGDDLSEYENTRRGFKRGHNLTETLLTVCKEKRQSLNAISSIFNAILANMHSDHFPSPQSMDFSISHQRNWMTRRLLLSFSIFLSSFTKAFPSGLMECKDTLSELLRRKFKRHWQSHLWPALRHVVENAILDDLQPTVNSHFTPENVCLLVTDFLEMISRPMFELENSGILSSTKGLTDLITHLLRNDGPLYPLGAGKTSDPCRFPHWTRPHR